MCLTLTKFSTFQTRLSWVLSPLNYCNTSNMFVFQQQSSQNILSSSDMGPTSLGTKSATENGKPTTFRAIMKQAFRMWNRKSGKRTAYSQIRLQRWFACWKTKLRWNPRKRAWSQPIQSFSESPRALSLAQARASKKRDSSLPMHTLSLTLGMECRAPLPVQRYFISWRISAQNEIHYLSLCWGFTIQWLYIRHRYTDPASVCILSQISSQLLH